MSVDSFLHSLRLSRTRAVMLGAGLLVLGFIVWEFHGGAKADAPAAKGPAGIRVDTAPVKRADVPSYAEGLGTVQAYYTDTITARVDGELVKVNFVEGQTVKKGDLLAQIDPRPYQAALDQAVASRDKDQAQLDNARLDQQRYETLAPQDLASKQTVDTQRALVHQLEAQVKSDDASIANARTQLDYTNITSPIDGRTGIRLVDPGNIVRAASTTGIVVVTQLQPISVVFTMPEDGLPALSLAMGRGPVKVTALSRDNRTELDQGTVALIDNQIDQTTGMVRLKGVFPNPHNTLWPGQFVNARVLLETRQGALIIPAAALERGPNGPFTYVLRADSTVEVRPLKLLDDSGDPVVVDSGLKEGEQVVTSNQYRLQPAAKVRTGDAAPAPGAQAEGGKAATP
jgi:multidrug efflux system membrane fusion protein